MKHRAEAGVRNVEKYTGHYNCIHVLYSEHFQWIQDAIKREKEIKGWTRAKKLELIRSVNPEMKFLEEEWEW
jgi:putative endonuclease